MPGEGKENRGLQLASVISDHILKAQELCENPKPGKIIADRETFEQLRHALDKGSCFFSPSPWLSCFLSTLFYREQKITRERQKERACQLRDLCCLKPKALIKHPQPWTATSGAAAKPGPSPALPSDPPRCRSQRVPSEGWRRDVSALNS